MRLKWISIAALFLLIASRNALCGYYPFGWQGWLPAVLTISDAPTSGVIPGSAITALDTDSIYIWNGSSWVVNPPAGTVTSFSFTNANGFSGSVANATSTPDLTLSTTVTGVVKGNGTALSAAASSDIIGLFTGCSGTEYLGADGACHTAGGSPGGSSSDVQYNSSSSFAGNSGFTYDGSGDVTMTGKMSSASANVSGLTASEPVVSDGSKNLASGSVSSPLTFSAGAFGCQTASGSQAGCLASADWTTFNSKQAALTFDAPLVDTSNTVTCNVASGSQAGCLASSDWTTFNNKQASGNYITALTGDGTASGPGSAALTLATVAGSPGTFPKVTFNGKGLVTSGTTLASGDIPNNAANTTGNAATATALASTPSQCSAGDYSTGIAASGAANCAQVAYSQVSGTPTLYYQTVQSSASSETQRAKLNFTTGITVADDSGNGSTDVNVTWPMPSPSPSSIAVGIGTGWAVETFPSPTPSGWAVVAEGTGNGFGLASFPTGVTVNGAVTSNCTSDPCTVAWQYPASGSGVSAVHWRATGEYTINFTSGVFTSTPVCVVNAVNAGNFQVIVDQGDDAASDTATAFLFRTVKYDNSALSNSQFMFVCSGP